MTTLTAGEKTLLRADGHKATLYLSILRPATLLAAQVNNPSIARGARTIAYDGGTGSGYASIEAGQTLWIGTAAGLSDVGTVRIKSVTGSQSSGTFTVAENSIAWADNLYLSCKHNWECWPVFPRISGGTFFKDFDVTYSDQNLKPPPVAVAGPPRAGFLSGGTLRFYLDASESYAVAPGASISSYLWSSSVGTINSPTSAATYIDLTTAPIETPWLKLAVTDSNGKSQSTMRPLFSHDTGSNYPYEAFQFESMPAGDWDRGGWTARLKVYGAADIGDFPDGALVLIWQEATYGSTVQNIGGYKLNSADARNVLFCGYIRADTTVQDWNVGMVSFDVTTVEALLRRHTMFSVSLQAVKGRNPAKWYEYVNNLTVARAVHHLWRWHSTLFSIADVMLPVSNTLLLKACDDFERSDLYSQAENLAYRHGIFAHVACNKWGRLYLEEDIQLLTDAQRAAKTVVSDITPADRREAITLGRQPEKSVSMVHLSGMRYDGNSALPVIAKAPGTAPEDMGPAITTVERQVLSTQGTANALAGRVLANANNTFKDVRNPFKGNYLGTLDIVPQEWWTLSLVAGDTNRAIVWSNQKLVCRHVDGDEIHMGNGYILATGVFEKEAEGPDGVTGDYPTARPSPITSFPPPPPPVVPPTQVNVTGSLLAGDATNGCWFRGPGYTNWIERNGGLVSTAMRQLGWDPWWPTPYKQNTADPEQAIVWATEVGFVGRSTDCGRTWTDVTPTTDPNNDFSQTPAPTAANVTYVQRLDNIHVNGAHYFLVEYFASAKWGAWLLATLDDGLTWTWYSLKKGGGISDGTYYYVTALYATQVANDITFHPAGYDNPCFTMTVTNPTNIIGVNDDAVTRFVYNYQHHNGFGQGEIMVDFGATLTTNASGAVQVRNANPYLSANPLFADWVDISGSTDGAAWTVYYNSDTWFNSGALNWGPARTIGAHTFRYLRFRYNSALPGGPYAADAGIDAIRVSNVASASGGAAAEVRPIWGEIDSEAGEFMYLTVCADDTLRLWVLDLSNLSNATPWIQELLGACTQAELSARTWVAFPFSPTFNQDLVYIFGRTNHAALGTAHVIKYTLDLVTPAAGAPVSVLAGLGADHIGALRVEGTVNAARTLYAIRNASGATVPKFYRGLESLAYVSDLPFGVGAWVPVDALTVSQAESRVAVGSDTAAAVMIAQSTDNGATWGNATGSFPVTGSVRSLAYV